jgi:hypothetical protein
VAQDAFASRWVFVLEQFPKSKKPICQLGIWILFGDISGGLKI